VLAVSNVKVSRSFEDRQLYDSEFWTEWMLTLKAFTDKATDIHNTVSNQLIVQSFRDQMRRVGWNAGCSELVSYYC